MPVVASFKDKGSKFEAFVYPIQRIDDVKKHLEEIKALHPKATHHCYAYRLGMDKQFNYRANDDGEPSGSAGRPILGQIDSFGLINVLIIVVRYYGGINLGIPGLIHAYKTAAKEALSIAHIVEKNVMIEFQIACGFDIMPELMHYLKKNHAVFLEQIMTDKLFLRIEIEKNIEPAFYEKWRSYLL